MKYERDHPVVGFIHKRDGKSPLSYIGVDAVREVVDENQIKDLAQLLDLAESIVKSQMQGEGGKLSEAQDGE